MGQAKQRYEKRERLYEATRAWCVERAVVAELDQAAPQLQQSDAEFDAAVLCYLPVVVISEEPFSDALREVSANLTTGAGWALGKLRESQNLDVGCVGLFPGDYAQPVYEMLAGEALATRIAQAREAQPRFHLIVDRVLLSAGPGRFQLTQYFYDDEFVLGVLAATRGTDIAFQQNLYPCSATGQEAIVAYAEQSARAAGRPLERIRHDGAVLVCPHCFEPVPLISEGDEDAQPLTHSLH